MHKHVIGRDQRYIHSLGQSRSAFQPAPVIASAQIMRRKINSPRKRSL
jgi:hypothetical protein